MASDVLWLCLAVVLFISTFGLLFFIFVVMSVTAFVLGCLAALFIGQELQMQTHVDSSVMCTKSKFLRPGIPKIIQQLHHPTKHGKHDQRLTGSIKIDEPLQEIIRYIIRDNICSWYSELTTNDDFINYIKELLQKVINSLAHSTKEVEWVSFFTRKLVDDFASHLRLYRQAEMVYKKTQKESSEGHHSIKSVFFDLEVSMEKNLCRDIVCTSEEHEKSSERHHSIKSVFFDLEVSMEKNMCRYVVCTSEEHEKRYLQYLSDVLLYLLLPPEDFNNKIFRYFLREIIANSVFLPLISLLSDPDYINQNLVWLCRDSPLTSKNFLTVIRRTDSVEELLAVQEIARHELKVQKSKDTGDKDEMKQLTKSIDFVISTSEHRRHRLASSCCGADTDSMELAMDLDMKSYTGPEANNTLFSLPFDIVLNNNVGLHYFTEFMTGIGAQGYVFFYHTIEAYRTSAETIIADNPSEFLENPGTEKLREIALHIFHTYLGDDAARRLKLDEGLLKKLLSRIKTESPSENWFDEAQGKVFEIMEQEFYCTGFKNSTFYVKLLAELDLLHDFSNRCDEEDNTSESKTSVEKFDASVSPAAQDIVITELMNSEVPSSEFCFSEAVPLEDSEENKEGILWAEIYSTGITHHAGKTFAVYAIAVTHQRVQGPEERWYIVRRYSEFHDLHETVLNKYPYLSWLTFPAKKAFNNLSRQLMEKRRHMLNEYIQNLLSSEVLASCDGLQPMLYRFLEPRVCEKGKKSFVRTVGTLVNPIKTSVKTVGNFVKLVPDTLFGLKDGLIKALTKPSTDPINPYDFETDKVSASLDIEADNIPLRIMLLLMDEIFDLKNKDLWFRRRIVALLRQVIKTTYGDTINRKIIDYVKSMASASQVAEWLKLFSQTFWPGGVPAQPLPERDNNTKLRTRIAAKTLLLCSIPDELKHVIGSETSCKGALILFNMFQHRVLNRRLAYVLVESCLEILFPQNNFPELFRKLHSESKRSNSTNSIFDVCYKNETESQSSNVCQKAFQSNTELIKQDGPSVKLKPPDKQKKCDMKLSPRLSKGKISRKLSFPCISRQDSSEIPPKTTKKRKKSIESAIFYADVETLSLSDTESLYSRKSSDR